MSVAIDKKIMGYSVVKPGDVKSLAPEGAFVAEADRRMQLVNVPTNLSAVLFLESRPKSIRGNPSWTYMVESPATKFAMVIGHTEGDRPSVFEVWVMGEAPRGLAALAKSLSLDARCRDRLWFKMKLESLAKTPGDSFDMTMPSGALMRMPSEVAAFARLLLWHCESMSMFDGVVETPLINSLLSKREPKTTPEGTLSYTVDIRNGATGDDFVLFLKEAVLPESNQRRPFSVWLAGNYPRSLDGLCKSLSLDMRIMPMSWIMKKLNQLVDVPEPMGDFMAQIPGSEKSRSYPSTVAYIAALIKYRLQVLGLDRDQGDVGGTPVLRVVESHQKKDLQVAEQPKGKLCGNCNEFAMVLSSGCFCCQSCGASSC